MNTWAVIGIIILILGVIVGNLLLLKHSANMKLPKRVVDAIAEKKKQQEQENQQSKK